MLMVRMSYVREKLNQLSALVERALLIFNFTP
jgi:hypothetical protein